MIRRSLLRQLSGTDSGFAIQTAPAAVQSSDDSDTESTTVQAEVPNASSTDLLTALQQIATAFASSTSGLPEPQSHIYYMPPDGFPFNEVNYVDLPAIAGTATIIDFQVPGGFNGVIRRIGNNFIGAGFQDGSGNLVWQILADGVPIRNHEHILGSLGNPALPSETDPIRIYEGQTITLIIQNVGVVVAEQACGGRLSGYFYPSEYDNLEAWGE